MTLHLTKVAFGLTSIDGLIDRWAARRDDPPYELGTRYLPKRWEEIAGRGSMFWILKHQIVARSAIVGFGELPGGRVAIRLDPQLVMVRAQPKRAHQGWRYLEDQDAPADLGGGAGGEGLGAMPAELVGRLAELGLV